MDNRTDRRADPPTTSEQAGGAPEAFLARALSLAPDTDDPPAPDDTGSIRELVHPFRPFMTAARQQALRRPTSGTVDPDAVWQSVADPLAERLARLAGRVLAGELAAARTAGALPGATGPERYRGFLGRLARRDRLTALLTRYPVLGGLLARECVGTLTALAELLDRLAADRPALADEVLPTARTARLIGVEFGAGDRHAGGRTVAVLRFAGGERLVYKPRPLGLHRSWNLLLDWFRGILPELAPRGVALLARDGYGWTGFVPGAACAGASEVESFYRRQGALLALCHAIDAVDLHCENVIASAGHPFVVDVETLFHPAWRPRTDHGDDPALVALNDSVARTGLLPWLMDTESGRVDISAFGAGRDGSGSLLLPDWADLGTDTMRVVRRRASYPGASNRPVLDGRPVDPLEYAEHLHTGFEAGYRAVLEHAAELTGPDGVLACFAGQPTRVVVRPSHVYAAMLGEATEPERLTAPGARAAAFAGLDAETGRAHLRDLARFERADLNAGDIPLFTGTADGRALRTARGAPVPVALSASGLDAASDKIGRMGEADLRRQKWLIAATLATAEVPDAPPPGAAPARPVTPQPLDRTRLLALACRIGDELIATSVRNTARTNWIGLELLDGRQWAVQQAGAGLAEGYPGPALFLAQLGRLTGIDRYTSVARHAAGALPGLLHGLAQHAVLARQVGPGGFFGLGGICYALARLATLLDDARLRDCVPVALDALASSLTEDESGNGDGDGDGDGGKAEGKDREDPGIGLGPAGGLAALRAVHADTGEPYAAELAASLAARLDRRYPPDGGHTDAPRSAADIPHAASDTPHAATDFRHAASGFPHGDRLPHGDTGFLHGDTGIRWATGRAAAPCPEGRDLGWSTGLAGAALAAAGRPGGEPVVRRFLTAAAERGPLRDQSLCHGELGVVDALIELEQAGYEEARRLWRMSGSRLLGAVEQYGVRCGTAGGVTTPGLLFGTAGIGYGLLRLGFAAEVPSVLLLKPGPDHARPACDRPALHRPAPHLPAPHRPAPSRTN
ncbi:type 2 lanthipeptide synthetase LanM family protein [Streptomyces sp. PTD5-9]|uniref:type 2 lanthipeptide synthetase LanM family protein n=1 Tax=Streptomyces sp. PTD5-9 TaxID=3120150 RepID=UPI00300AE619